MVLVTSNAKPAARASFGSRVVIVEDEPEIAEVLQITLEQHGFQVIVLGNGSFDALVSLCPQEPHLLVCDLKLPDGSGVELCGMVLERYPKCEIILMTGAVDVPDAVPVRGGFNAPILLRKPFFLAKFVELAVGLTTNKLGGMKLNDVPRILPRSE